MKRFRIDMSTMLNTLVSTASKKSSSNGLNSFKVSIQAVLDHGFDIARIKKIAKAKGMRLIKNDTALSFESKDLDNDIKSFLHELNFIG